MKHMQEHLSSIYASEILNARHSESTRGQMLDVLVAACLVEARGKSLSSLFEKLSGYDTLRESTKAVLQNAVLRSTGIIGKKHGAVHANDVFSMSNNVCLFNIFARPDVGVSMPLVLLLDGNKHTERVRSTKTAKNVELNDCLENFDSTDVTK